MVSAGSIIGQGTLRKVVVVGGPYRAHFPHGEAFIVGQAGLLDVHVEVADPVHHLIWGSMGGGGDEREGEAWGRERRRAKS
jgi:hypothetical protein